jgi:hypothetical protein
MTGVHHDWGTPAWFRYLASVHEEAGSMQFLHANFHKQLVTIVMATRKWNNHLLTLSEPPPLKVEL